MKSLVEYITETKLEDCINHKYPDDEVKSAIWDYVAGYTTDVNNLLRKGKAKQAKVVTDYLDQAFKDKMKLDVYRTVDWDYFNNIHGITKENIDENIGKEITNKGYMSTTIEFKSPWGTWDSNELVMHITSDKPYPYIDINKMFPNDDEIDCSSQKEILLPRDTTLKLVSYSIETKKPFNKNGTYVLEMKLAG